ncbi:LacI family transcriptional regulator [Paracoccus suum]|uniref:LacI family transcriptional regulator n=1 Tax=Paracoccus suum TaxID=2259340 RepID=A0A344PIN2_9RHOB|nr:LacI family DNA-binding transcriptional regulator [Paracoccus suum]AXC49237.1 LacI family transcriptional regulator [Paracoccus suum]
MSQKKPVTVRDIADAAKVSRATAARALNGYGYVGDDTAVRVQEAAARLGYRGNRVAQALRQGQMPIVGFVPGDIQNPFFARIAHDLDGALRPTRHSLMIASSEESIEQEREVVDSLRSLNVRGLIVAPASADDTGHLVALVNEGVPLVIIDRMARDVPCSSVTVDNEGGAREAISYFVSNGHRRIALIHDDSRIVTARERLGGYVDALTGHGLAVEERLIAVSQSTVESTIEAAIRLFSQPEPPTALLTVDSLMTTGALLALRSMGLSVPHDVSLIGFDDFDLATFTDPQITVVSQPVARIGAQAVKLLQDRITGTGEPEATRFPTRLIIRGSVGKPGGQPRR